MTTENTPDKKSSVTKIETAYKAMQDLLRCIPRLQKIGCFEIADQLRGEVFRLQVWIERLRGTESSP